MQQQAIAETSRHRPSFFAHRSIFQRCLMTEADPGQHLNIVGGAVEPDIDASV